MLKESLALKLKQDCREMVGQIHEIAIRETVYKGLRYLLGRRSRIREEKSFRWTVVNVSKLATSKNPAGDEW